MHTTDDDDREDGFVVPLFTVHPAPTAVDADDSGAAAYRPDVAAADVFIAAAVGKPGYARRDDLWEWWQSRRPHYLPEASA